MIIIHYEKANGHIISLKAEGHANYDEYGKDIICASVSGVLLGGLNALQENSKFEISIEDGFVSVKARENINEHDSIVLETLFVQLQGIQENYKEFVKIKRKE